MSRKKAKPAAEPSASVLGHGDLGESLLYIFPLFLCYEIGVLFSPSMNGADFVTRAVFFAVDGNKAAYLGAHLALALGFIGVVLAVRKRRALRIGDGLPMVFESAIYALTLGSVIVVVLERVLGLALNTDALVAFELGTTGDALVASLGAGVHEELVFRLGLFAGIGALLRAAGARFALAMLAAALVSSALFSLAHHVGPHGELFELRVFIYRALAGLAFAAIFYYRSLAHAVYSHFLYDVYVLVIHP